MIRVRRTERGEAIFVPTLGKADRLLAQADMSVPLEQALSFLIGLMREGANAVPDDGEWFCSLRAVCLVARQRTYRAGSS